MLQSVTQVARIKRFGLPLMTFIGTEIGWRTTFLLLGALGATIALLSAKYLPSIGGEKLTKSNSPFAVLKIPSVMLVLVTNLFICNGALWHLYLYHTIDRHYRLSWWYKRTVTPGLFSMGLVLWTSCNHVPNGC